MSTIEELLKQLDLGKYAEKFVAEEIDLAAASSLSEADLQQLGLPLGPRKKFFAALHGGQAAAPAPPAAPAAGVVATGPQSPAAAIGAKAAVGTSQSGPDEKINKFVWHWQRGGGKWPDSHGSGANTFLLEPGPKPERLITFVRSCVPACQTALIKVWDIAAGRVAVDIAVKAYPCDSDILDGIIACCPDDRDVPVQFFDVMGQRKGAYESPGEGSYNLMSLFHNSSGALQVCATESNCRGDIRLFDVATGARAGKISGVLETYLNRVIRDPVQASFVWIGENNGKVHGLDMRTNKQARLLLPPEGLQISMSNSLGMFCSGSEAFVMDLHTTGRVVRTIKSPRSNCNIGCSAIYSNVVALGCEGQYFFYDLDNASDEPAYDLKGQYAAHAALTKDNLYLFASSFVSMERVA